MKIQIVTIASAGLLFAGACKEKTVELPDSTSENSGASVEVSKTYRVEGPKESLAANQKTTATIVVKARDGFDVNPEYPWKFTFDDPEVTTKKVDKSSIKFETGKANVPFEVTATKSGKLPLTASGSFSICKKGDKGVCYFVKDEPFPIELAVAE